MSSREQSAGNLTAGTGTGTGTGSGSGSRSGRLSQQRHKQKQEELDEEAGGIGRDGAEEGSPRSPYGDPRRALGRLGASGGSLLSSSRGQRSDGGHSVLGAMTSFTSVSRNRSRPALDRAGSGLPAGAMPLSARGRGDTAGSAGQMLRGTHSQSQSNSHSQQGGSPRLDPGAAGRGSQDQDIESSLREAGHHVQRVREEGTTPKEGQ